MKDLNPCKLRDLSDESRAATIALLEAIIRKHEQFLGETEAGLTEVGQLTAIGLDIVLEALGAEGHEFT